jgi:hypothetical protein
MAFIFTSNVTLLNSMQNQADGIRITPKPIGNSRLYFFKPEFVIRPWPDEGELPASIIIELEIKILRPEIFQFGASMAMGKRYLVNSSNIIPIGFTLRTLQDIDEIGFHQLAVLFMTKDHSQNVGVVENPFGFRVAYDN